MDKTISTVFFDLDGTLADTAIDLTAALNQLLLENKRPAVSLDIVRPIISKGSSAMLRLGLNFKDNSEKHLQLKARLFEIYTHRNHSDTTLFSGIDQCLATLEHKGYQWGIVTNKLTHLAEPVIDKLQLQDRISCLVCADTTGHAKPHPAPLLFAAKQSGVEPQSCIYIGDAKHDIVAAKHANMTAFVAGYGYIPEDEDPNQWQAESVFEKPEDLISWLNTQ